MSKDFDDIYKKIDQSNKEMSRANNALSKDQDKMMKDIIEIKKEIKDIAFKVETMLEILNNFTIMLAEDDEDLEENYEFDSDNDETWVPKDEEYWEDDNSDDESI